MYDRFMEEQRMLNTVVNKVHPVTGETIVPEKTIEELANATHPDTVSVKPNDEDQISLDGGSASPKRSVRYEPHLVKGEKDG